MLSKSRCCRHEPQPKNCRALTALPSTARHCWRVNASCKHLSSLWVCVCVWYGLATGASLRLYLRHDKTTCNIRASGAPLQTQPYLTPNIPRGQRRARVAQTRPDKTSHCLPPNPWAECRAHKLGTVHQSACKCVYRECSMSAATTAENNSVTLQWRKSSAQSFSFVLLIGLEVNGVALNTNGQDPSSSTDLNINVETRTKHPSLMLLFGGIYFTSILRKIVKAITDLSERNLNELHAMTFKVTDSSVPRLQQNL